MKVTVMKIDDNYHVFEETKAMFIAKVPKEKLQKEIEKNDWDISIPLNKF